jgi:hypothetical protein
VKGIRNRHTIKQAAAAWIRRHIRVISATTIHTGPLGERRRPPDPDVIDVDATPVDDDGEE